MSLAEIWFGLFVLIIAGYLILDGFDIGVGIVHLVVCRDDQERRLALNSIGPVWDGNEVWLVLGGGVLFAAFPFVYASLFSGFYLAFVLVLFMLILRTVAIEFRSRRDAPSWRRAWDVVFSLASIGLGLLFGVAFGNILAGVDIDSNGDIHASLIDLLTPYALLIGLTALAMFALHGLLFLALKTTDALEERVRSYVPRVLVVFFALNTVSVIATAVAQEDVSERFTSDIWPVVFPALALVAFVICWRAVLRKDDFLAFAASAAMIGLLLISGAVGMYPNLLISTQGADMNLTVQNAASANNTLAIMMAFAAVGIPLVLLYTAGVYFFFRGKTSLGPDSY